MSGCVTVIGPPASICAVKVCSIEPREPSTLPNRTDSQVRPVRFAKWAVSSSARRLVLPSTLVASAALSVEMFTKRVAP